MSVIMRMRKKKDDEYDDDNEEKSDQYLIIMMEVGSDVCEYEVEEEDYECNDDGNEENTD